MKYFLLPCNLKAVSCSLPAAAAAAAAAAATAADAAAAAAAAAAVMELSTCVVCLAGKPLAMQATPVDIDPVDPPRPPNRPLTKHAKKNFHL